MNSDMREHQGLTTAAELVDHYDVTDIDLVQIREYGKIITPKLDQYVAEFYGWLETQAEFDQFFSNAEELERAQNRQGEYWCEFFEGNVDEDYVNSRRRVGETHARIGLPLAAYFVSMNRSSRILTESLYDNSLAEDQYNSAVRAVTKLLQLDIAVVAEALVRHMNRIIAEQHEAMLEMSTPVTEIWQDILMLPIIGIIDSKRAQEIMTSVLSKIAETYARWMILDISGVGIVDTAVANHLIKITKATELMGCRCTVSGLSPAIAQTIVELGIDVGEVRTTSTLKDALDQAFRESGVEMKETTVT